MKVQSVQSYNINVAKQSNFKSQANLHLKQQPVNDSVSFGRNIISETDDLIKKLAKIDEINGEVSKLNDEITETFMELNILPSGENSKRINLFNKLKDTIEAQNAIVTGDELDAARKA